jgi:hypothetical protein
MGDEVTQSTVPVTDMIQYVNVTMSLFFCVEIVMGAKSRLSHNPAKPSSLLAGGTPTLSIPKLEKQ